MKSDNQGTNEESFNMPMEPNAPSSPPPDLGSSGNEEPPTQQHSAGENDWIYGGVMILVIIGLGYVLYRVYDAYFVSSDDESTAKPAVEVVKSSTAEEKKLAMSKEEEQKQKIAKDALDMADLQEKLEDKLMEEQKKMLNKELMGHNNQTKEVLTSYQGELKTVEGNIDEIEKNIKSIQNDHEKVIQTNQVLLEELRKTQSRIDAIENTLKLMIEANKIDSTGK